MPTIVCGDQVRKDPRCLRVVLALICVVLSACSLQVEESDVAGVYVAHFKSGTEKLQLQRGGSFVQEVLVRGVETRNFGTWPYERTDGVIAVLHLTDCLAVDDGFGDIHADFATQRRWLPISAREVRQPLVARPGVIVSRCSCG
jgi:hypothetical protein